MSAANKGVLSTARNEEGSKILTQNCAAVWVLCLD